MRDNLERMLAGGRDDALLRYTLGNECYKSGDLAAAAEHLRRAVEHDPRYTAAWKQLGRVLEAGGDPDGALQAWEAGLEAAEASGDVQAGKEMTVFARRLRRKSSDRDGGDRK